MVHGLGARARHAVAIAFRIAHANAASTVSTADLGAGLRATDPIAAELGVYSPPPPDAQRRRPGTPALELAADVTRVLDRARDEAVRAGRPVQAADLGLALLDQDPGALAAGLDPELARAALERALSRELADPILEPQRLPITAQLVLSVFGESEEAVRERARRALAEHDAADRLAELLQELLGQDLDVRGQSFASVRADWPERPPERHVACREGTVWVSEDWVWEDVPGSDHEVEYLTGTVSAHWSRPEGEHEPGPTGQSLEAILAWARWRAPRVVVQVAGLGRFSAGELADPDLEPLPDGGLRLVRRPSPSSRHLLRDPIDPPILWDVRVTAVPDIAAASVRAFVDHIAAQPGVIDLVSWDGATHPPTGYAATFLLRHATYDQAHARASELVQGAFEAISADLVGGWTGVGFELYPFDGDDDARRDPPSQGRVY